MSLNAGRGKLFNSMKVMRAHWDRVQDIWNDPVRQDFEENFWNPLAAHVDGTLRATDRLEQVLLTMYRDCAPDRSDV